jgi:hypothetical protein
MKHAFKPTIKLDCKFIETLEITSKTNSIKALLTIGMLDITDQSHSEPCDFDQFLTSNTYLSKAIRLCEYLLEEIHEHIQIVSLLLARTDDEEVAKNMSQVGQLLLWLTELDSYFLDQQKNMEFTLSHYEP